MTQQIFQDELNSTLWNASAPLRGSLPPSGYKDYLLVMLFLKYLSDRKKHGFATSQAYMVPDQATIEYLYDQRDSDNLGVLFNEALQRLEQANPKKLEGVFHIVDFSSANLGHSNERNSRLRRVLEVLNDFNFGIEQHDTSAISSAFDAIIQRFAADDGKMFGKFYTPDALSVLLAKLLQPKAGESIYDPTCGVGNSLIRAAEEAGSSVGSLFGQEINRSTWAIAQMNMLVHEVGDFDIRLGNTLKQPLFIENGRLKTFDVIVSNPPLSLRQWGVEQALHDEFNRFTRGVPPGSNGDYAFISHIIASLESTNGRAGVITSHGALFRGSSETEIRRRLVEENLLDAVIGLPPNLLFGTGIPVAVLIFKRNRSDQDILFIDASEGFVRDKIQNRLLPTHIDKIVSIYRERRSVDRFSQVADLDEIARNDYNLNVSQYVDTNPHFINLSPPVGYELKRLAEVVLGEQGIQRGISRASLEKLDSDEGNIPFVSIRNILSNGVIDFDDVQTFPRYNSDSLRRGLALPGDILISTTGTVGRVAMVPNEYADGIYFNQTLHRIRADEDEIHPLLLYKALRSDASQLELSRYTTKSVQSFISNQELRSIRIIVPNAEKMQEVDVAALEEADTISRSIRETLSQNVIATLEKSELEDVQEQIIDILENTLFTLRGPQRLKPEEIVLQHYPLPIALAYHRMLRAHHNPYEQSARLIELNETLTYFFYNVLLSDYLHNPELQILYRPTQKKVKRAFEDFQMGNRLKFIDQLLKADSEADSSELKMPELREIELVSPLDYVKEYRNNEYHSISGSPEAVRNRVLDLRETIDGLLNQLTFLRDYRMCRIHSLFCKKYELFARIESFTGTAYETNIGDMPLQEDEQDSYRNLLIDEDHVVLLTPEYEILDLYPLYQVKISEEYRYESHLCFAKQVQDREFTGESIKFRSDEELEGYAYIRQLAENASLIGRG